MNIILNFLNLRNDLEYFKCFVFNLQIKPQNHESFS